MKHVRLILMVLVVALVAAVPVFAQNAATVTITEATINSSYRVTNPVRRSVSNVQVDLQPGQAVITATVTLRNKTTGEASVTLVPAVQNGRVTWTATAATWNGEAATGDALTAVNRAFAGSWRSYLRSKAGTGRVTSVTITDNDITYAFTARR